TQFGSRRVGAIWVAQLVGNGCAPGTGGWTEEGVEYHGWAWSEMAHRALGIRPYQLEFQIDQEHLPQPSVGGIDYFQVDTQRGPIWRSETLRESALPSSPELLKSINDETHFDDL